MLTTSDANKLECYVLMTTNWRMKQVDASLWLRDYYLDQGLEELSEINAKNAEYYRELGKEIIEIAGNIRKGLGEQYCIDNPEDYYITDEKLEAWKEKNNEN